MTTETRDLRRTWLVVVLLVGGVLALTLIVTAVLIGLSFESAYHLR